MTVRNALALAALALPALAAAQNAPVSGNLAVVSDYRFRGISQSYLGPAVQGGVDYAHPSGAYVGNWNSSVSSSVYTGGSGIEMDFYGGWKKSYGDIAIDVGGLYYYYPQAECNQNNACTTSGSTDFNHLEAYFGASWKWLSGKLFYSLTDYFGLAGEQADGGYWVNKETGAPLGGRGGSEGTWYFDLTVNFPLTRELSLVAHYGWLELKKYNELDYKDWKLGVTYDLAGWLLGAAYVDTDADKNFYYTAGSRGNKETGNSTIVFSVTRTF
jgi:hypothetical protein